MKRPSSAWLWVGLAVLLLVATPWVRQRLETDLSERRAREAWAVRRGDKVLEADAGPLFRARGLFLEGRFQEALVGLRNLSGEEARQLRRRAEEALTLEAAWPSQVVLSLTVDLDRDGAGELVRVVEPGFDEPPRLEVSLPDEEYRWVQPDFRRPGGEALNKTPDLSGATALRLGKLTGSADALLRTASHLVVLVEGPRAFVFDGEAQLEDGGVRSGRLWRWKDGRFHADS